LLINAYITTPFGNRSQVQRFKVPFLSLDCIWEAYLRERRQLSQT
jgi:hypothetical protein